jgi:hypothetical protein
VRNLIAVGDLSSEAGFFRISLSGLAALNAAHPICPLRIFLLKPKEVCHES